MRAKETRDLRRRSGPEPSQSGLAAIGIESKMNEHYELEKETLPPPG